MAKGKNRYSGLVRGPHLKNSNLLGTYAPTLLRDFFTVHTKFTNVAASCITQPGGPGVGDPWS